MSETKKIENIIKASELYETIEVIQDCLSHFEELDYIQEYNIVTPSIKENLLQDECQCGRKCYCVSAIIDYSLHELDLKKIMIDEYPHLNPAP